MYILECNACLMKIIVYMWPDTDIYVIKLLWKICVFLLYIYYIASKKYDYLYTVLFYKKSQSAVDPRPKEKCLQTPLKSPKRVWLPDLYLW